MTQKNAPIRVEISGKDFCQALESVLGDGRTELFWASTYNQATKVKGSYLSGIRHHGVSKATVEYAVEYEKSHTGASSISYLLGKISNYLAIADELTKMTDAACQLDFVQVSNPQLQEEKSTGIEALMAEETVALIFRELN
jgi:hypothetical protein